MKEFKMHKLKKNKNKDLFVFIDESGSCSTRTRKKNLKRYRSEGIMDHSTEYFSMTGIVLNKWQIYNVLKYYDELKVEHEISHAIHRTDFSYKSHCNKFEKKEINKNFYSYLQFFYDVNKILNDNNVKSFSNGYNYKVLAHMGKEIKSDNIQVDMSIDLIRTIISNFKRDATINTGNGVKIYFVFEKTNSSIDSLLIAKFKETIFGNDYGLLFMDKNTGSINEICDIINYHIARSYTEDLYLPYSTSYYMYPQHLHNSKKINQLKLVDK